LETILTAESHASRLIEKDTLIHKFNLCVQQCLGYAQIKDQQLTPTHDRDLPSRVVSYLGDYCSPYSYRKLRCITVVTPSPKRV